MGADPIFFFVGKEREKASGVKLLGVSVFSRAPRRQSELLRAQTERRKSFSQRVAKMGRTIPRRQGRSARNVNRTRKLFLVISQLMNLYLIISDAEYTHRSAVGPRGLQRRPLRLY